jgi:hypothetical protein
MTTLDTLIAAVVDAAEAEMERDPVPAAIAAMCEHRAGKPLNVHDSRSLEAEFPGLSAHIDRHSYGTTLTYWTNVTKGWGDNAGRMTGTDAQMALYRRGVPDNGNRRRVLISRALRNVRWPSPAELQALNESYAKRDARNADRNATIAAVRAGRSRSTITAAAQLIDAITTMYQELEGQITQLPPAVGEHARAILTARFQTIKATCAPEEK